MAVACVAACSAEDEVLRQGSRGEAVQTLQRQLVAAGYRIAVDGIYGPNTAAAVRAFQRSRGLPGTGRADAATHRSLARPLQRGDRGSRVLALQRALNRLGAGLTEDGIFGPNTERAVRAAQESGHDLSALATTPTGTTAASPRPPAANADGRLQQLIREAERVLGSNPSGFRQDVFVVVDLARHSSEQRFFIVDRGTGSVSGYRTSHGSGSDPRNTGRAQSFSNTNNSHQTSVGVYRTAETYSGRHGYSLRLDGLSGTNSRARARAIVIHGADYVSEAGRRAGRSWGCFALDMRHRTAVIDRIKNGALLYAPDPNR